MLPALTFVQFALLCKPVDSKLSYQQWTKVQNCHKAPRCKKKKKKKNKYNNPASEWLKKKSIRVQAWPPRSAHKVIDPHWSCWHLDKALQALWGWSRLAAAGLVGLISSCSPFCLSNSLSLPTSTSSSLLSLLYTMLFLISFCYWYAGPECGYQKEQPRPKTLLGSFFSTSHRSDKLWVSLSLPLFQYCNFSSLILPTMLLLSCGYHLQS